MSDGEARESRGAPAAARVRRLFFALLLLSTGGAAGLVLGSLLEAPRLLLRSWVGPVQRVELESAGPAATAEVALTEFDAIQRAPLPSVAAAPARDSAPAIEAAGPGRSGPVVQVRAYRERSEAEGLVRELRARGFQAFISRTRGDAGTRSRVRVVPLGGEPISLLRERLQALGYETWTTSE